MARHPMIRSQFAHLGILHIAKAGLRDWTARMEMASGRGGAETRPLTAAQHVRVLVCEELRRVELDGLERFHDRFPPLRTIALLVNDKRLLQNAIYGECGIDARIGVLRNHLSLAAKPHQFLLRLVSDVLAVVQEPAIRGLQKTDNGPTQRCFSRPALANDS